MSAAALAHAQAELASARHAAHAPSSLPSSSVYRWALLSSLRRDSSARFARWATSRSRNVATTLVHKPVVEYLAIKTQLKLQLAQRPLLVPMLPVAGSSSSGGMSNGSMALFDNALAASWRAEAGVRLRDLRSVALWAHSACLMRSFPIGGGGNDAGSSNVAGGRGTSSSSSTGAASSTEREWVLVRQGATEQSLSLLEWRPKGSGDPTRRPAVSGAARAALLDEHDADSPFAPSPARRERMAGATAASASARSRSAAAAGTFVIPGMHMQVLAGVWGRWDGDNASSARSAELAFLWLSVPYSLLLAHLPWASPSAGLAPPVSLPAYMRPAAVQQWTVRPDDLDSALGLHGLRVNISLRSAAGQGARGGRTFWSWFYNDITACVRADEPAPSGALGHGAVELHLPPLSALAPRWNAGLPSLAWKGELWSGRFERLLIVDLVIAAEDDARILWLVSQPVSLDQLDSAADSALGAGLSMDAPDERAYAASHRDLGVGALRFEMTHAPAVRASADGRRVETAAEGVDSGAGVTRLQSLHIALDLSFVDSRFGTSYARAGAASLGHALQQRAREHMSDQQYAQFQREQMGLRAALDDERPLPAQQQRRGAGAARGGVAAAAAPHHAPHFTVHAPAAAAAANAAGAGPAASGAGARGRAGRPQWQDTAEKRDEDEGFKF
jgi:hypothetical protein